MKFYRIPLLIVIGGLSAVIGWVLYVGMMFWRFPVPVPSLTVGMWGIFIGVPVCVGALTALFFPTWQRVVAIRSRPMRSVSLWLCTSILVVGDARGEGRRSAFGES